MATTLLFYSLISGAVLSLLWGAFRLAGVNRLTCHRLNRLLLVSILALSVILPLVAFIERPAPAPVPMAAVEIGPIAGEAIDLPAVEPAAPGLLHKIAAMLPTLYMVGVATSLLWLLTALLGVALAIVKGEKRRLDSHTTLVIHRRNTIPFTWGRWIVISRADLEANSTMLLSHEMAHKAAAHWLDLLLARVVACVDWYWPTVWLLNRDLAAVHEYQADSSVILGGADAAAYQKLLISKGSSPSLSAIANPFNYNSLKNLSP